MFLLSLIRRVFGHRDDGILPAIADLKEHIMSLKENVEKLTAEVAETKASIGPVVQALKDSQASNEDLKVKLQAALEANDGEETNALIQEAIAGLDEAQATLRAAVAQAPEVPVDPETPADPAPVDPEVPVEGEPAPETPPVIEGDGTGMAEGGTLQRR